MVGSWVLCLLDWSTPREEPSTWEASSSSSKATAKESDAFAIGGRPPPPLTAHSLIFLLSLEGEAVAGAREERLRQQPQQPRSMAAASGSVPGVVYPIPGT